jgi:hypothetical protein
LKKGWKSGERRPPPGGVGGEVKKGTEIGEGGFWGLGVFWKGGEGAKSLKRGGEREKVPFLGLKAIEGRDRVFNGGGSKIFYGDWGKILETFSVGRK